MVVVRVFVLFLRSVCRVVKVRRSGLCGLLRDVSAPSSLHRLDTSGLPRIYGRLERGVVSRLSYGPKRFNSDLNMVRLAITLRCMFGAPCSHVM